jgi:hypothetical protein
MITNKTTKQPKFLIVQIDNQNARTGTVAKLDKCLRFISIPTARKIIIGMIIQ